MNLLETGIQGLCITDTHLVNRFFGNSLVNYNSIAQALAIAACAAAKRAVGTRKGEQLT